MSEKIVQLNEEVIKGQLKELVRGSVQMSNISYEILVFGFFSFSSVSSCTE